MNLEMQSLESLPLESVERTPAGALEHAEAGDTAALPPLSLYIHFPWCVRKCPYCDFNSHALRGELPEGDYIAALLRDLDYELIERDQRPLLSIFMGGGTPSLFSGRAIGALLDGLGQRFTFVPDIEITLEANPGTADAGHFRDYRGAGVTRLSIGVQSLDEAQLKRLGRIHGREDVLRTVKLARGAGFDNLNLDLMFALPQQTPEEAETDLRAALALAPEHLSYYQLTLEPNTEFAARPPLLPDDESAWDMQETAQALLAAHGYAQYEVSAYARAGRQCRHNRNYWQFGDYLAIGAGAHGKRTSLAAAEGAPPAVQIRRNARHKHPRTWLETAGSGAAIQEARTVTAEELPFEYLMNALRLNEGFATAEFERRTGLAAAALEPGLRAARSKGLVEEGAGRIRASTRGFAHLNALLREFL